MRIHICLLAFALTGCDFINAVNKDKPSSEQSHAIGDIFGEVGTVASVTADPAGATNDDLVTAMTFLPFVRVVKPEAAVATVRLRAARPATIPGCLGGDDNTRTFDCEVTLPDGRHCVVSGSVTRTIQGESSSTYAGSLMMHAGDETCPDGSMTLEVHLEGPLDSPTVADGNMSFSYQDPPTYDYSGTGTFDHVAVTAKCPDLPSSGEMMVSVQGSSQGSAVNDDITLSFHESPGCGVVLIE